MPGGSEGLMNLRIFTSILYLFFHLSVTEQTSSISQEHTEPIRDELIIYQHP
jgi:hypothetical protein